MTKGRTRETSDNSPIILSVKKLLAVVNIEEKKKALAISVDEKFRDVYSKPRRARARALRVILRLNEIQLNYRIKLTNLSNWLFI